jgi:hypothetical protein
MFQHLTRHPAVLLVAAALAGVAACGDDDGNGPAAFREATQVERFGLPAIATVFIPSDQKDAYNEAAPAGDPETFQQFVVDRLTAFGNPDPEGLADALQPDIQPINTGQESGFLNGRRPQDDVITAELGLIFGANADLNDDHVNANDRAFLAGFPYLAAPHRP